MSAEPMIDLMAGVTDFAASAASIPVVSGSEYGYSPHRAERMRRFCKLKPKLRTHHQVLVTYRRLLRRERLILRVCLRLGSATAKASLELNIKLAAVRQAAREADSAGRTGLASRVVRCAIAVLGACAFVTLGLRSAAASGADVDQFGIQKIYADAPPPINNWVFTGDPMDPRFMEQRLVAVRDGWFRPQDPVEMRMEVLSDPSANENSIETFDVAKVLAKGYLYKPPASADGKGDFLNIEQTWRFRVRKTGTGARNGSAHLELVPGGYQQTSSMRKVGGDRAVSARCESMSYHFNVYPTTGRVQMEKDSDHTSGYTRDDRDPVRRRAVPRFDNGREVIPKAVLYRTAAGMKLEMYLDMTGRGDHFEKVLEYEDCGQWGPTESGNAECDCSENVVLSMARVAIGYRCDNLVDFEFKDLSIRSIDPTRPLRAK